MDCKKMEELIFTDYADGKITGQAFKDVEAHLASCHRCRALASELASIGRTFKAVKPMEAPTGVWEKIRSDITREPAGTVFARDLIFTARSFLARLRPVVVMVTAAVLILVAVTVVRLMPQKITTRGEDILSIVALEETGNGAEYDFGTPAESYFL